MKKLILIIFVISSLNSCVNTPGESTSLKDKIKSNFDTKNINKIKDGIVNQASKVKKFKNPFRKKTNDELSE